MCHRLDRHVHPGRPPVAQGRREREQAPTARQALAEPLVGEQPRRRLIDRVPRRQLGGVVQEADPRRRVRRLATVVKGVLDESVDQHAAALVERPQRVEREGPPRPVPSVAARQSPREIERRRGEVGHRVRPGPDVPRARRGWHDRPARRGEPTDGHSTLEQRARRRPHERPPGRIRGQRRDVEVGVTGVGAGSDEPLDPVEGERTHGRIGPHARRREVRGHLGRTSRTVVAAREPDMGVVPDRTLTGRDAHGQRGIREEAVEHHRHRVGLRVDVGRRAGRMAVVPGGHPLQPGRRPTLEEQPEHQVEVLGLAQRLVEAADRPDVLPPEGHGARQQDRVLDPAVELEGRQPRPRRARGHGLAVRHHLPAAVNDRHLGPLVEQRELVTGAVRIADRVVGVEEDHHAGRRGGPAPIAGAGDATVAGGQQRDAGIVGQDRRGVVV